MGLPNNGIQYYLDLSGEIKKHLYISISGLSLEENLQILDKILKDVNIKFISGLEIMGRKNYYNLEEFRGKLKNL